MGDRSHRRVGKFYQDQVEQILGLLKQHFKTGQLSLDAYLNMCEQLGEDPDPEKMPPTIENYPHEVQVAFFIHQLLPDRWEGMSGHYMGKDMSSLGTLLDVWNVEDKKTVVYFIKHIESNQARQINEEAEQRRKAKSKQSKGQGGINSANIKR